VLTRRPKETERTARENDPQIPVRSLVPWVTRPAVGFRIRGNHPNSGNAAFQAAYLDR
jgi:hypothetical protein